MPAQTTPMRPTTQGNLREQWQEDIVEHVDHILDRDQGERVWVLGGNLGPNALPSQR